MVQKWCKSEVISPKSHCGSKRIPFVFIYCRDTSANCSCVIFFSFRSCFKNSPISFGSFAATSFRDNHATNTVEIPRHKVRNAVYSTIRHQLSSENSNSTYHSSTLSYIVWHHYLPTKSVTRRYRQWSNVYARVQGPVYGWAGSQRQIIKPPPKWGQQVIILRLANRSCALRRCCNMPF